MYMLTSEQLNKIKMLYGSGVIEQVDDYFVKIYTTDDANLKTFQLICSTGLIPYKYTKVTKYSSEMKFYETTNSEIHLVNKFGIFPTGLGNTFKTNCMMDIAMIVNRDYKQYIVNTEGKIIKIHNRAGYHNLVYLGFSQYALVKSLKTKNGHALVADIVDCRLNFIKKNIRLNDWFSEEYGISKISNLLNSNEVRISKPIT